MSKQNHYVSSLDHQSLVWMNVFEQVALIVYPLAAAANFPKMLDIILFW